MVSRIQKTVETLRVGGADLPGKGQERPHGGGPYTGTEGLKNFKGRCPVGRRTWRFEELKKSWS